MVHQVCLKRQALSVYNKTDHDLPAELPVPDQNMPDQTFSRLLIVRWNLVQLHIGQHAVNDLSVDLLAEHAVCHRNNGVSMTGVKTCHDPAGSAVLPGIYSFR